MHALIADQIRARQLLDPGQRVLVAVSGGVDSMVLLHALRALAATEKWRLFVAHYNHQLRGRNSDADERFVIRAANELGLRCVTGRGDVKGFSAARKVSIEMAGRELRHAFLAKTARRLKCRVIALAHHADDQLELFFLRLLRGAGDAGLAGMRWRRPSPADPRITLIRPLLGCGKAEIERCARERGIRFRSDASNKSLDHQRNRIRHELLPLLRGKYQPGLDRVIPRIAELAGANADFVGAAAREWMTAGGVEFENLHVAIQRCVIQVRLAELKIAADFELIERLRLSPNCRVSIGSRTFLIRGRDGAIRAETNEPARRADLPVDNVSLGETSRVVFAGRVLQWKIGRGRSIPARREGREAFDADAVGNVIQLRHWRPGDRFQPIGMSRAVKLQDLFTNAKIPSAERAGLVVACAESGELFWVERLRIGERFKVTASTKRRLLWHWKPR